MKQYRYTINGHAYEVTIRSADAATAEVEVNGRSYSVRFGEEEKSSAPRETPAPKEAPAHKEKPAPEEKPAPQPAAPEAPKAPAAGKQVIAPLPGLIREVRVQEGDSVTRGQTLMILEAMKMENEITADSDGTVASLLAHEGDTVQGGDPLAVIG